MFEAKFKLAAASLIRAAMVEDFDTAEVIISQHDPYELTRAMAVTSAQGWTITNGYNLARAVESLDVLASVFEGAADDEFTGWITGPDGLDLSGCLGHVGFGLVAGLVTDFRAPGVTRTHTWRDGRTLLGGPLLGSPTGRTL